jgi:hypothetical protein
MRHALLAEMQPQHRREGSRVCVGWSSVRALTTAVGARKYAAHSRRDVPAYARASAFRRS